jgi:hypothetical protein
VPNRLIVLKPGLRAVSTVSKMEMTTTIHGLTATVLPLHTAIHQHREKLAVDVTRTKFHTFADLDTQGIKECTIQKVWDAVVFLQHVWPALHARELEHRSTPHYIHFLYAYLIRRDHESVWQIYTKIH